MTEYDRPPGRLEDPAYRLNPDDWKHFHTRSVTPRSFQRALVPPTDRGGAGRRSDWRLSSRPGS